MGSFEFCMMTAAYLLGTAAILVPVLGVSEQDMWMAGLLGSIVGAGYVLALSFFRWPEGRHTPARVVLSLYSLHLAAQVSNNLSEITNTTILPNTPPAVFAATLVLLSTYASSQGIEVIARLAGVFMAVSLLMGLLLIFMAIPVMHPENLQPVFEHSIGVIVLDSISFIAFPFMEMVVFLPLIKKARQPMKSMMCGTLMASLMLIAVIFTVVMVLPPGRIKYLVFLSYVAINTIPATNFVKALLILVWLQTGFLKLAVLHYVAAHQLGEAFSFDHRRIILPLAVLIAGLSLILFDNGIEAFNFTFKMYPLYAIPLQLAIPLYFLIAAKLSGNTSGAGR